jgi:hypothetical protein
VHPLDGLQESVVQTLLSLHGAMGVYTQPVVLLHESVVQALLSLQLIGVYVQPVPGLQPSRVQTLLSLHVMLWGTHVCVATSQLVVSHLVLGHVWLLVRQPVEGFGQVAGLQKVESQVGHKQEVAGPVELVHVQKLLQVIPHRLVCGHSSWSSSVCWLGSAAASGTAM